MTAIPWKELMLGQGVLTIGVGLLGLSLAGVVPMHAYKFLATLTPERFNGLYALLMRIIIAYGLFLFAVPVLLISMGNILARDRPRRPPTVEGGDPT